MKILACLCLLFAPGLAHAQYSYVEAYRKAVADLSEGNAGEGLKYARLSDSLRPNHPQIMYLLAVAYIENKDPKDAIHVLRKRATFYALTDFEDDPAFNTLREHSDYAELLKEIGIWNEPQQQSKFAFRIQAEGLHAEGITYDPKRNLFWVGDVRSGQVLACGTKGGGVIQIMDLPSRGFWSALGLAMNPNDPDRLWLTSSAMPQFQNYDDSLAGSSALIELDLTSGTVLQSISIEGEHLWGDLIVDKSGAVYVSDSMDGHIYRWSESEGMQALPLEVGLWNPQGMAFSSDGKHLYVADYIIGVYRIDLETYAVEPLFAENGPTKGTDGLYSVGENLVLIQNGTIPKRISTVPLGSDGLGLDFKITDRSWTDYGEPTLGVLVDGKLFYIANSPWTKYDDDGKPKDRPWPFIEVWSLVIQY